MAGPAADAAGDAAADAGPGPGRGNCPIAALRQLSGLDFAPSSYCEARARLPLQALQWLLGWLHARAAEALGAATQLGGPRVLVADGSSYSMPDTPALRKHFDLPPGTKEALTSTGGVRNAGPAPPARGTYVHWDGLLRAASSIF